MSAEDHPLHQRWCFWEHRSKDFENDKSWMDQFLKICEVNTVEMFWQFWMSYSKPSVLFRGSCPGDHPPKILREGRSSRVLGVAALRSPVPPETKALNEESGEPWTGRRFVSDQEVAFEDLEKWDQIWEVMCLLVLGETVSSDLVNGVWIGNRTKRGSPSIKLRIEIWSNHGASEEEIASIPALFNDHFEKECGRRFEFELRS